MTTEEYRQHPALHFSKLAALDKGPQYLRAEKEYTEAMKLGSVVDCLITDPHSFDKRFIVCNVDKPTGQLEYFVDQVIQLVEGDNVTEEVLSQAYENTKQWNGGKLQAGLEKFKDRFEREGGKEYFEFVLNSQGKEVISNEDYINCNRLANTITGHEFTAGYFESGDGIELLFQYPIIFEYRGFQYKILLDLLRIDHNNKTISPFDIKTTNDGLGNFKNSVWKYRYDIQSSLYTMGVFQFKKKELPDYNVDDFKFIVGSFINGKVSVFNAKNLFNIGANGGTTSFGYKYKGWEELSRLYQWHIENQIFDYTKEVYDSKGEIMLEV